MAIHYNESRSSLSTSRTKKESQRPQAYKENEKIKNKKWPILIL